MKLAVLTNQQFNSTKQSRDLKSAQIILLIARKRVATARSSFLKVSWCEYLQIVQLRITSGAGLPLSRNMVPGDTTSIKYISNSFVFRVPSPTLSFQVQSVIFKRYIPLLWWYLPDRNASHKNILKILSNPTSIK